MADRQRSRREQAQATRRRIIEAATDEFTERGYHGATIASIAARAGVATQTVYFVFHTKPELISAAIDYAVLGGDDPSNTPQESEWWDEMMRQRSAVGALRTFVRGAGPLFARASGISEILRGAALTDDDLWQIHQHHENLRRQGFGEVITLLETKGKLRAGLDRATATDVLMTVLSDATYYSLTVERGWSHEQCMDWMCDALPRVLLG
jgi:AcrR family transcriptional regulator